MSHNFDAFIPRKAQEMKRIRAFVIPYVKYGFVNEKALKTAIAHKTQVRVEFEIMKKNGQRLEPSGEFYSDYVSAKDIRYHS